MRELYREFKENIEVARDVKVCLFLSFFLFSFCVWGGGCFLMFSCMGEGEMSCRVQDQELTFHRTKLSPTAAERNHSERNDLLIYIYLSKLRIFPCFTDLDRSREKEKKRKFNVPGK